jgi:hypothetical protein
MLMALSPLGSKISEFTSVIVRYSLLDIGYLSFTSHLSKFHAKTQRRKVSPLTSHFLPFTVYFSLLISQNFTLRRKDAKSHLSPLISHFLPFTVYFSLLISQNFTQRRKGAKSHLSSLISHFLPFTIYFLLLTSQNFTQRRKDAKSHLSPLISHLSPLTSLLSLLGEMSAGQRGFFFISCLVFLYNQKEIKVFGVKCFPELFIGSAHLGFYCVF